MNIQDQYIKTAPSVQNALNIFQGEWASKIPGELASFEAGKAELFEDARIAWAVDQFGGVADQHILELGPLEAGHTYMLEKFGAKSIVAIEANTRAFIKCLIIKEILQLKRAQFLCGDFVQYLQTCPDKFDLCIASGVLYHMVNPVELIKLISQTSQKVFIWTHYFDRNIIANNSNLANRFDVEGLLAEYEGFRYTLYRQNYNLPNNFMSFCGGSEPFSFWMSRDDILLCLNYFGFNDIQINFDNLNNHRSGPSFAIVAQKNSS